MSDAIPAHADVNFEAPPLTEMVIGVQFDELFELTPAHMGWFWREHLSGFSAPVMVPPLDDLFERFPRSLEMQRGIMMQFAPEPVRMQFRTTDGSQMVQVQRSRFIFNWMQTDSSVVYPRWRTLLPRFEDLFAKFSSVLSAAGLGAPRVNQWEVVYVNHVARGTVWQSPADWPKVVPSLFTGTDRLGAHPLTGFRGHWVYDVEPARGRLHVEVAHTFNTPRLGEILAVQLTARGPADPGVDGNFRSGLELGHDVIVNGFVDLTHPDAHKLWGRRK